MLTSWSRILWNEHRRCGVLRPRVAGTMMELENKFGWNDGRGWNEYLLLWYENVHIRRYNKMFLIFFFMICFNRKSFLYLGGKEWICSFLWYFEVCEIAEWHLEFARCNVIRCLHSDWHSLPIPFTDPRLQIQFRCHQSFTCSSIDSESHYMKTHNSTAWYTYARDLPRTKQKTTHFNPNYHRRTKRHETNRNSGLKPNLAPKSFVNS